MLVLNFHRVEQPTGLEITRVSPRRFARLIDFLSSSGLSVSSGADATLAPDVEILITFDDGFRSIAEHALPALRQKGWSAVVFLIAGVVGKADDWDVRLLGPARPMMDWPQVREWSQAGFEFGSHTMTHADLTALSPRALREELIASRAVIEDRLGRAVRCLSYPFGRHNRRVRDAVADAGYTAAFASQAGIWDRSEMWAIPRVNVHALFSLFDLRSAIRRLLRGHAGDAQWHGRWRNRLFASLNAGSAIVVNWRRQHGAAPARHGQEIEFR